MINLVLLLISWIHKVQIHSWNRIILIGESRVIPVKDHEWQQSSLQIMLIRLSVLIITTTISNHLSKSSNKKEKLVTLVVKRTWHLVTDLLSLPQNLKTLSSQKTTLTYLQTEHQAEVIQDQGKTHFKNHKMGVTTKQLIQLNLEVLPPMVHLDFQFKETKSQYSCTTIKCLKKINWDSFRVFWSTTVGASSSQDIHLIIEILTKSWFSSLEKRKSKLLSSILISLRTFQALGSILKWKICQNSTTLD